MMRIKDRMMNIKDLGMFLLSIWLILSGIIAILHLSFIGIDIVMAVIAIGAGILLLLRR
jgi:hypothetical protein